MMSQHTNKHSTKFNSAPSDLGCADSMFDPDGIASGNFSKIAEAA